MRRGQTKSDRCAELVEELLQRDYPGATVERVWRRTGGEYKLDVSRWGVIVRWTHTFTVYCWDTMTECARNGITLVVDEHSRRGTDMVECSSRESCCRVHRCPVHGHAEGCCSPRADR